MTFTFIWVAWILAGVGIELFALHSTAKGDTLSEQVWALFDNATWGKFSMYIGGAFLVWMAVHFLTRGKWA